MTPTSRTITVRVGKPVPAFPNPDDPRPRYAAALVDPMLAATGHPAADDGPDWPEVRAYMGRNPHTRDNQPAASDEPQVQNTRRASRAFDVLHGYALHAGGLPSPGVCGDTPANALRDLLVDVRHAADALGLDYADLDLSADDCYRAEAEKGDTLA